MLTTLFRGHTVQYCSSLDPKGVFPAHLLLNYQSPPSHVCCKSGSVKADILLLYLHEVHFVNCCSCTGKRKTPSGKCYLFFSKDHDCLLSLREQSVLHPSHQESATGFAILKSLPGFKFRPCTCTGL